MRRLFGVFGFLVLASASYAGHEHDAKGARATAMGRTGVCLEDSWSAFSNPASLAFIRNHGAGLTVMQRFGLSELSDYAAVLHAATGDEGAFGVCLSQFGNAAYAEREAGISYAQSFGKKVSFGVGIHYLGTVLGEGYGSSGGAAVSMSIESHPVSRLRLGAQVFNPNRAKLTEGLEERIPTTVSTGGAWIFSERVILAAEAIQVSEQLLSLHGGLEYAPVKQLHLRGGMSTQPLAGSLGAGISWRSWKFDLASQFTAPLGPSTEISISCRF